MDLLQLKYFQTVARHQHMTQAAKELRIAQPSLSQMIARLEDELGVPLFDRQGRQIRLNHFGERFLDAVNRQFQVLESGIREVRELAGLEKGYVSLATLATPVLTPVIRTFKNRYPEVKFFVQQIGSPQVMYQLLETGEVDFCLSSYQVRKADIHWEELTSDRLMLIVPENHRLAGRTSVRFEEIVHESFTLLKASHNHALRNVVDQYCLERGYRLNIEFEVTEPMTMLKFVDSGLAVSFVPLHTLDHHKALKIVPIPVEDFPCHLNFGLAWKKNHYFSRVAALFRDYLIENYKLFYKDMHPSA